MIRYGTLILKPSTEKRKSEKEQVTEDGGRSAATPAFRTNEKNRRLPLGADLGFTNRQNDC
jgi:hypothetical protein